MDWTGGLPSTITGALVYLTVSLSLSIGIIHFIKRQHRAYLINLIPGPKTDPIFGNTLQLNVEPKETAMGRKINAQDNSESDYVKSISRMLSIAQMRQTRPWLQPNLLFKLCSYSKEQDRCLKILHGFSNETIRDRKNEYRDSRRKKGLRKSEEAEDVLGIRKKLAFLDLLLEYSEEKHELSDEDLREEVDTFMFEGHDTTGAAINWTIYLLGSHPEIQEKVAAEMEAIFGESERKATANDIHEMRYLECCIKEALRLFPVVPFIGRELKEEMYIDGFRIPVGTSITIMPYRLHRDPAQFPEPESFIPERFYPENSVKRHPYAYIPFSAGPRNCIGQKFALMEAKVVLSWFVRNFRVESTVKRENLGILGELILRPEDGTVIKLYPRK